MCVRRAARRGAVRRGAEGRRFGAPGGPTAAAPGRGGHLSLGSLARVDQRLPPPPPPAPASDCCHRED